MRRTDGVIITEKANAEICVLTAKAFPFEACGILLGSKEEFLIEGIIPIANIAEAGISKAYFEINPLEMYKAERLADEEGKNIVGIFHSHPGKPATLSKADEKYMIPGMIYLIASAIGDTIADLRAYLRDAPSEGVYERIVEEE